MSKLHEYTSESSGVTIRYRILAADTLAKIEGAIRREWAEQAPQPPTVELETGPGQVEAKTNDKHPDYLNALAAFDARVTAERGRRLVRLIADYAIVCEVDEGAVEAHRAALAAVGVDLADESDKAIYLWEIALADSEEQQILTGRILGSDFAAAVEAQRRAFRRTLEGPADRVPAAAAG